MERRICLKPHERLYLTNLNVTDCVQIDALHNGTLFFSGGNDIIGSFEGVNPEEIAIYDTKQPFAVGEESTIVVDKDGGLLNIVLTTPESEMSNTCVYIDSDIEGKLTIIGGQSMICGIACIDLSKFSNRTMKN